MVWYNYTDTHIINHVRIIIQFSRLSFYVLLYVRMYMNVIHHTHMQVSSYPGQEVPVKLKAYDELNQTSAAIFRISLTETKVTDLDMHSCSMCMYVLYSKEGLS